MPVSWSLRSASMKKSGAGSWMARAVWVSMQSSGRHRVRGAPAERRGGGFLADRDLEDAERGTVGEQPHEQRHRDVVDRHVAFGGPFELAPVRVAVHDERDR